MEPKPSKDTKRHSGPDRLTYHHTLTLTAGEKFINRLIEEHFKTEARNDWAAEWIEQAKLKNGTGPIEFLAQKTGNPEEKILSWGSRLSSIPIIDCDHVISANTIHYVVDGIPLTLLSTSEFGAVTLVHCLPFLETLLDTDLLADIYGGLKVNFALSTPSNFLRHFQKIHTSGKARNRVLKKAEEDPVPNFVHFIEILSALELLPPEFSREATREEILEALGEERPKNGAPGETEWWALCSHLPYLNLATIPSSKELLEIVLPATQKTRQIVPICEYGGSLTVASKRGFRGSLRQEIVGELQKHCKLNLVLSHSGSISEIITANLTTSISTTSMANAIRLDSTPDEEEIENIDIQELADGGDPTVIKLVQSILISAINKKATDIHIAAHPENTWVRYRIDGNMVEAPFHLPFQFWKAIISRIKIMSNIDIKYSPIAQDGKFPMNVSNSDYDIRVNTCPVIYGEKAVLRIQKKEETVPTLEGLGFYEHERNLIHGVIDSDHGLLIICGPTGSGKCLGKGTPVLKYNGDIVPVETIKTGDLLMGPDSKPRRVNKTNTGTGPLFQITPSTAGWEPWVCNDAHILTLTSNPQNPLGTAQDIPLESFLKNPDPSLLLFRILPGTTATSPWKTKPLGQGDYYGFTLDGDGRFLLGDFTVTHNTTTLSATMYAIDRKRWNVITAENPVEIRIPHVEQTPIDGIHMTFGKFVPAALRQDPDYIMIGETRDKETTEEVIRAAITGHVVMTTLHTNSAAGAPGRLIDMGAQPFLITDSVKAVCAQRLIRRLCSNCARPSKRLPTKEELLKNQIPPEWLGDAEYLLEPVGCKLCNGTGYRGRIAIVEGYFTSPEIRRIIINDNADSEKIRKEIENQGGKTLYQHAVEHAAKHTTSMIEALTVRSLDG